MMKFRVELWRIAKFILITLSVNLPLRLLNSFTINWLLSNNVSNIPTILDTLGYVQLAISCAALTLLHRYFTFRSAEKWYVALPFMVGAWLLWSFSNSIFSPYLINAGSDELAAYTQLSPALWIVLQYLLQRYVLYVHTVDTNGWYRRSHPTNDA